MHKCLLSACLSTRVYPCIKKICKTQQYGRAMPNRPAQMLVCTGTYFDGLAFLPFYAPWQNIFACTTHQKEARSPVDSKERLAVGRRRNRNSNSQHSSSMGWTSGTSSCETLVGGGAAGQMVQKLQSGKASPLSGGAVRALGRIPNKRRAMSGGNDFPRHLGDEKTDVFPRWLLRETEFRQLAHTGAAALEKRRDEAAAWIKQEVIFSNCCRKRNWAMGLL